MNSDRDVLYGYLFASRYISRDVYTRYGFDPSNYKIPPASHLIFALQARFRALLIDNPKFGSESIDGGADLREALGDGFEWVRTKHDATPVL